MFDAIVIGKGPAGISAAIYLARANRNVLVIGKGIGALEKAEKIDNYYGFTDTISGEELSKQSIKQAERLGIEILTDEVTSIEKAHAFTVSTPSNTYQAKSIFLASGKQRTGLKVKGFREFQGKGISFCAVCDGFFYRDKALALIGSGDYAAHEYEQLRSLTDKITVFTDGSKDISKLFPTDANIVYDKITEISGDVKVEEVLTSGDESYPVDGIFVAIGTAGASNFAQTLGIITQNDNIVVDEDYMTNLDGLFAGGDCIGGLAQIAKSVSDGAIAATNMIRYIKNFKEE